MSSNHFIRLSIDVPLDGDVPNIKMRFSLPEDREGRFKLINKMGAVLAGLISGNLDAPIYDYLRTSKHPLALDIAQKLLYYREVFDVMTRSSEPLVCPTKFGLHPTGEQQ